MCVLKDYSCIQNSIPFTVAAGKEETSLSNTQYLSKIQKCIQLYSKAAAFLYFPLSYSYALWQILPKYWWVSQTLHFPLLPPRRSSAPRFLTLSIHSHFVKPMYYKNVTHLRAMWSEWEESPRIPTKNLWAPWCSRKKYYLDVLALLLMYLLYPITHGLLRVSRMSTIKCSRLLMLHLGLIFCIVILCLRIASEAAAAALKYSSRSSLGCWERSERISLGILWTWGGSGLSAASATPLGSVQ